MLYGALVLMACRAYGVLCLWRAVLMALYACRAYGAPCFMVH